MKAIILEKYESLFKNSEAFKKFVQILEISLEKDLVPIIYNEKVIGYILSKGAVKKVLLGKFIKNLIESPGVLDKLRDRIENDKNDHYYIKSCFNKYCY